MANIRFLLSNDDGFRAPGVQELARALMPYGEVVIVAPDGPRSGYSSAITTTLPMRLKMRHNEPKLAVYSVDGTPVDCVKLALNTLFAHTPPTLVISGINHGSNDGISVHYSGTVGAAREGAIQGVPSLAVSLDDTAECPDFSDAIAYTIKVVERLLAQREALGSALLSLNVPKTKPRGLRVCRQAVSRFVNEYMPSQNARGHDVYWLQGYQLTPPATQSCTDVEYLREGFATLTALTLDQTDYTMLSTLGGVGLTDYDSEA